MNIIITQYSQHGTRADEPEPDVYLLSLPLVLNVIMGNFSEESMSLLLPWPASAPLALPSLSLPNGTYPPNVCQEYNVGLRCPYYLSGPLRSFHSQLLSFHPFSAT